MMKSFVFLVVFISPCILVQGIDEKWSGSQCQCCDQCDQSATVSKLLVDISNLLLTDDLVNATSTTTIVSTTVGVIALATEETYNPTTTVNSFADSSSTTENPSASVNPSTTPAPSTTQAPSTTHAPSNLEESSTTLTPFTTQNPNTTQSPSTINYSSDVRDSIANSIMVNPLPTTKSESTTATVPLKMESSSTIPSTTVITFTAPVVDSSTKISSCPDNCFLDITGVYCNCYQPTEKLITIN